VASPVRYRRLAWLVLDGGYPEDLTKTATPNLPFAHGQKALLTKMDVWEATPTTSTTRTGVLNLHDHASFDKLGPTGLRGRPTWPVLIADSAIPVLTPSSIVLKPWFGCLRRRGLFLIPLRRPLSLAGWPAGLAAAARRLGRRTRSSRKEAVARVIASA